MCIDNDCRDTEAVKTWMEGSERYFDTLTIGEFGMFEEAAVVERELETLLADGGLEAAMNQAEHMAVAAGFLDPDRSDPRLFFEDNAPTDPFMTNRRVELAQPTYSIQAISANDESFLDVMKTWGDDSYERLTIPQRTWEEAQMQAEMAFTDIETGDLQDAMQRIERAGVDAGVIDPDRDDPRLFKQGPPDPFITERQRNLAAPQYDFVLDHVDAYTLELRAEKSWNANNGTQVEVLELRQYETDVPEQLRDGVDEIASMDFEDLVRVRENTGLEAAMRKAERMAVEAGTLDAERADPRLFEQGPPDPFTTLREEEIDYHLAPFGVTWRETMEWSQPLQPDVEALENSYHRLDVRKAQNPDGEHLGYMVVASAYPEHPIDFDDVEMDDTHYPSKAWAMTLAHFEMEHDALDFRDDHRTSPLSELADNAVEDTWQQWDWQDINHFMSPNPQIVQPEDWQPQVKPSAYWRFDTVPVNDPEGESLGHALHMIVYDGIESDPEAVGTPAMPDDEPFRMLEVAHFETTEAADQFVDEFRGYLMPGVLEGPELAEEVARLEGFELEWQTLEGQDLAMYRDLTLTITHDFDSWQPYNPNAERDARIAAEGMYTDPIHKVIPEKALSAFDKDRDDPKAEPAAPDFDL